MKTGAPQPIRVVHLIDRLEIGGMERVLATIVSGLDRSRYRARVLCLSGRGPIADELKRAGITVDCFEWNARRRFKELLRLARWLREHEIVILHTHGYSAGVLGRVAGVLARTPVRIAHLHTTDWGFAVRQRWIEWGLSWITDRVICCSHSVGAFATARLGLSPGVVSVIRNGVPLRRESESAAKEETAVRRLYGLSARAPVIGIIGSLTPNKGHAVALRAFARLRRDLPDARMLIVGDGPERARLHDSAEKLGLLPAVVFTGRQASVTPLMAACDVVCLPSVQREGLGLAVLEAMTVGKAVVGSDLDGIREAVAPSETGALVPPNNADQLAETLASVLTDPDHRRAMGANGLRRVEQLFSESLMLRRITELYDELCARLTRATHRPVPILYVTCRGTLERGGQHSLLQLLSHLDRRQFRPVLLCPERGDLSDRVEALGIEAMIWPLPQVTVRAAWTIVRTMGRLASMLRRRRIPLVHTDAPRETFYAGIAAAFGRAAVLWHIRASTGDWSDRWLATFSDRLVLVAEALRPRFRFNVSGEDQQKLTVIHNGVELAAPASIESQRSAIRKRVGAGPGTVVVISVGRVEPLKGADVLLDALGQLPRACRDYRLLLIGQVDPVYRTKLEAQAKRLQVADRVEFAGYQQPVQPWIAAADLLVHPSLYEAFPRAILEAMALAKPVIASRVGGVAEAVLDGETGLLVPAEQPDALAAALERCLLDGALRERMGKAGRQRVEQQFGAERHARQIEAEYHRLLAGLLGGRT
ncbi:MAG: glycosyltransferase [Nitrospirae bacterium]|nr:glycosyltransferase [Nitrospirota bacterium]